MRTRRKDRDVPSPDEPWSEIVPGLWMGGHYWTDAAGELRQVVVGGEFDLVVSLYTRPGHGPDTGCEHLVAEVPDAALAPAQLRTVRHAALSVRDAVDADRRTLVRCHSGYNRSGLVVAEALTHLGHTPHSAVELIRRRRSPWALNNKLFVQYLGTGLDVAELLAGLDAPG